MGRRLALLIGNALHEDSRLLPLNSPSQDIDELGKLLRDSAIGNFDDVAHLRDATYDAVRRAIEAFFKNRQKHDLLVLYFSGHGFRADDNELYLAHKDTDLDAPKATAVPAAFVRECMRGSRSQSQALVLDCCFSGAFMHGAKSPIGSSSEAQRLIDNTGIGRTVLTATDALQYAFDGNTTIGQPRHSVFTHYLIQGLRTGEADKDGDGLISIDELFKYLSERMATHSPPQTPCKWTSGAQGDITIARANSSLSSSVRPDVLVSSRLPHPQKIVACLLLLVLNSLLAALGSLLWGHFPYWPAFMLYGLASIHLGFWGIALAALTPVVSSLLGIGGAPPYLYVPANVVQALLCIAAFRCLSIDTALRGWLNKVKYIVVAAGLSSAVGACIAWSVRRWYDPAANDPALLNYVLWWTGENVLPALIPGIWLHHVVSELYAPFSWQVKGRPSSWRRRTIDYASPWMIALLLFSALIVGIISQQLALDARHTGALPASAVAMWETVFDLVSTSAVLQMLVIALMLAILCAIGMSIRFAKRTWALETAVSRHLPFFFSSNPPVGMRLVTIVSTNLVDFDLLMTRAPTRDLVDSLDRYLEFISDRSMIHGGYVHGMLEGRITVIFGIADSDAKAQEAVRFAIDLRTQRRESSESVDPIFAMMQRCHVGIHSGWIMAAELGSRSRRQFAVLGEAARVARDMDELARHAPDAGAPIVLSHPAAAEAGLLVIKAAQEGIVEMPRDVAGADRPLRAYCVKDIDVLRGALNRPPRTLTKSLPATDTLGGS